MEKFYPMIIAVACLCIFLIYLEIKRDNKSRLVLRLLATVLTVFALLMLIMPLKYAASRSLNSKELILLTEGSAIQPAADSLYYTLDSAVIKKFNSPSVKYIADLPYYLRTHEEVNRLRVYGNGLPTEILNYTKGMNYEFVPAANPEGVIAVSWPKVISQSESLEVQGTYHNAGDQPVKLLLEGAGTAFDSLEIPAHQTTAFALRSAPKQMGRAVYSLRAVAGKMLLSKSPIPFEVSPVDKLKILVLASYPDFEYKFLKNWLLENKYPAVFRTRISKEKFSTEQVNIDAKQSVALNSTALKNYDLVIADDEELAQLGASANTALKEAVRAGLGMLIRFNETKKLSALAERFSLVNSSDTITTSFVPVLNETGRALKSISTGQSFFIQAQSSSMVLVRDQKAKVLVSNSLYGNGRIAATVLSSTYNWILSGFKKDYADYWAYVLSSNARKQNVPFVFHSNPTFAVANEPVNLDVESGSTAKLPGVKLNESGLSVLQNTVLPFFWQSTAWVQAKGWNRFQSEGNKDSYFYVYDKNDWKALKDYRMLLENRNLVKKAVSGTEKAKLAAETFGKEVSKWWFFGLFLCSVAYLWFETKML